MLKLFDSHCHLQFPAFDENREQIVARLSEEGIGAIIVGTNRKTSHDAVALAEKLGSNFFSAIAIHPSHVYASPLDQNEEREAAQEEIFSELDFSAMFSSSKKIIGVGECGLDFYRIKDRLDFPEIKEKQIVNFHEHIKFARARKLPLIIHARDAHFETESLLREESAETIGGVMHCFTGTPAEAEKYLNLGFYLSLTCAITYPPRRNEEENPLLAIARYVPLDRLLIETDAPYLAPRDRRGLINDPTNVKEVAAKIAEIKGLDFVEVAGQTVENAKKLFHLADRLRS